MNVVEQQVVAAIPSIMADGARPVTRADGGIPQGQRNAYLASLAGSMRARGMTPEAMVAALLEENRRRCQPPLSDVEVRAIATSIARYVPAADGTGLAPDAEAATAPGLDPALLDDVTVVVAEGQQIERDGVPYVVEGLIPALGMVGVHVAFAKVGKSTVGQQLAGAVAAGTPFLDLKTRQARVLLVAAEDPPEYTAYLARHLTAVPAGQLTFFRHPIQLNAAGLGNLVATVQAGRYGLVLIASWQAVVATQVRDENDNAGVVRVMESVKAAARATGIPWLIDAHSGKGEDQSDEADPTRALRGASGAAGSADFILSLRYADGPFKPMRRLSGKGRFVSFAPILMTLDLETGGFTSLGSTKNAMGETTWQLIDKTGALTTTLLGATSIAVACGLAPTARGVTGAMRRQINAALQRPGVRITRETRGGKTFTKYALDEPSPA